MDYDYDPEIDKKRLAAMATGPSWEAMVAAKVQAAIDSADEPDPDRTFLGILRRELMAATEREKAARAALAEYQANADHFTRERVAIERAINAYQGGAE